MGADDVQVRPVTAPDLDAIEARANAAPEGPYFDDGYRIHAPAVCADPRDGDVLVEYKHCDAEGREAAGAFFAAARTDVPALVDHVRALHAAVRRVDKAQRAFDAAPDSYARATTDAECDAAMLALFALVPEVPR